MRASGCTAGSPSDCIRTASGRFISSVGRVSAIREGRPGSNREKVAILVAMTVGEQMPLADVKNRLSEVVERLEREHGRVVITKHGHPAAVVISVADLESLEETLDVMGSEALMADIREALAELATAEAPVLGQDEALRMIPGR